MHCGTAFYFLTLSSFLVSVETPLAHLSLGFPTLLGSPLQASFSGSPVRSFEPLWARRLYDVRSAISVGSREALLYLSWGIILKSDQGSEVGKFMVMGPTSTRLRLLTPALVMDLFFPCFIESHIADEAY